MTARPTANRLGLAVRRRPLSCVPLCEHQPAPCPRRIGDFISTAGRGASRAASGFFGGDGLRRLPCARVAELPPLARDAGSSNRRAMRQSSTSSVSARCAR